MKNFDEKELQEKIILQLKHIFDPEIPVNIYDLGLIYKITIDEKENKILCNVDMTLTSPGCPVADNLVSDVKYAINVLDEIDETNVNLTFTPPWDKNKVSEEGKELMLTYGFLI